MRLRLYTLIFLFVTSATILISTAFSFDKTIDVEYSQLTPTAKRQVDCLAQNIYYEAGWEPEQGKVAVAMVTMNRLQQSERFGKEKRASRKRAQTPRSHQIAPSAAHCNARIQRLDSSSP